MSIFFIKTNAFLLMLTSHRWTLDKSHDHPECFELSTKWGCKGLPAVNLWCSLAYLDSCFISVLNRTFSLKISSQALLIELIDYDYLHTYFGIHSWIILVFRRKKGLHGIDAWNWSLSWRNFSCLPNTNWRIELREKALGANEDCWPLVSKRKGKHVAMIVNNYFIVQIIAWRKFPFNERFSWNMDIVKIDRVPKLPLAELALQLQKKKKEYELFFK